MRKTGHFKEHWYIYLGDNPDFQYPPRKKWEWKYLHLLRKVFYTAKFSTDVFKML
ncbi:MAG: hypothetical protein Q4D62_03560 [Planctomycetia bacterium]|nr:hypothetical protein [Planctomycetia bacterium]